MDVAIITAIISAVTTLVVSMGTWHLTAKTARKKETEEIKDQLTKVIESYRDELRGRMEKLYGEMLAVKEDLSELDTSMQKQVLELQLKIDGLAKTVEKHNEVVDRTYKLEDRANVQAEQIKVANHRIEDLERRI